MKSRIIEARELLRSDNTTAERFEALEKLLKGINPKLDKTLAMAAKALKKVEQFQETAVIELTAEGLPEKTEKQKKRKKYLLLFLQYWDDLKDEVERVRTELQSSDSNVVKGGKIVGLAKGPLGAVTAIAAAIAGGLVLLNSVAVSVVIKNNSCDTIEPQNTAAVSLPGLVIPNQPIPDGGMVTATLPPLTLTVDNSSGDSLKLTAYGLNLSFDYSGEVDIIFDGTSLIGKATKLNLGDLKQHELIISCK